MDKIRVGVIGAGWGARTHLPAFLGLPDVKVIAVCTAHQETAEGTARRFGIPKAYWDYRQLVGDKEIDLVSIATRVSLHYPIVIEALKAGKHILCEWPLALNARQAQEMLRQAEAAGVVHSVGNQGRFVPALAHMRDLLQDGFIGEPLSFDMTIFLPTYIQPMPSQRLWLTLNGEGGTALTIQGGHAIDILCWCLGEVEVLSAHVDTLVKDTTFSDTHDTIEVTAPDASSILFRMKGGAIGSVNVSRVAHHGSGFHFQVYGTKGTLVASSPAQLQYSRMTLVGGRKDQELKEIVHPETGGQVAEGNFTFSQLAQRMAQAIKNGEPMSPDFSDAVYLHCILDAAVVSSARKGWVKPNTSEREALVRLPEP